MITPHIMQEYMGLSHDSTCIFNCIDTCGQTVMQ